MAIWSDNFTTDTSANYDTLWYNVSGGSTPSAVRVVVENGYLESRLENGGYCLAVVYLKSKPTINPLTENFIFEVKGQSHAFDGFDSGIFITNINGSKFLRFCCDTYQSPDLCSLVTHVGTIKSESMKVDTPVSGCTFGPWNKFRIEKTGKQWKFFLNDALFWEGEIPEINEELYIGFLNVISSGRFGYTAITRYDDYYFEVTPLLEGFATITNITAPSSARAGEPVEVTVTIRNDGNYDMLFIKITDVDTGDVYLYAGNYVESGGTFTEGLTGTEAIIMPNRDLRLRIDAGHVE